MKNGKDRGDTGGRVSKTRETEWMREREFMKDTLSSLLPFPAPRQTGRRNRVRSFIRFHLSIRIKSDKAQND